MSTILVVEDEALIADDIQRTLVSLGYDVPLCVATAAEAIEAAEQVRPQLTLMDIKLEGAADGIYAAKRIHQDLGLPVVYLTSHSDESTLSRAKEALPYGYLIKPFTDRELRIAVELALHRHAVDTESRIRVGRAEHLAAIVESTSIAVVGVSPRGVVETWNAGAKELFGYDALEIIGKSIEALQPPEAAPQAGLLPRGDVQSDPELPAELVCVRRDGARVHVAFNRSPIRSGDRGVVGFSLFVHDISARKRAEDHLHFLATHDSLTRLPNRSLFHDRLTQALSRARWSARTVGVLFLDLDGFKEINDSLGHSVGDRLLVLVAERLSGALREGDTVARIGGDEFVVVLADVAHAGDLSLVMAKIDAQLSEPFEAGSHSLTIAVSVGLACYPRDGENASDLLRHADAAMYGAKTRRRQCLARA